jgi:hypothetical protein
MLPSSPACRCAGLIGSTPVPPEVSKLVADLERRLEEAHCRLERAEDDAQHYLKRAESDLTKARDQAAHLQTQMDIIHAGYRTMVEDCRIQVDRAHDANSRLQDECNVRVAAVLNGGASPTQPTSVSALADPTAHKRIPQLEGELVEAQRLIIRLQLAQDLRAAQVDKANDREKERIISIEKGYYRSSEHLPTAILDVARLLARSASASIAVSAHGHDSA